MIYLTLDYVKETIVPIIERNYSKPNNPAHNYLSEKEGLQKLEGCLERVKWDYVQGFYPKAAQLFLEINLGHFFVNGNKRMALTTLLTFIFENDYAIFAEIANDREEIKKIYLEMLLKILPEFQDYEDETDFTAQEFGFYNLTLITLEARKHGVTHDDLKKRVEKFLDAVTASPEDLRIMEKFIKNK
ncbi:MAG TPA: type II toxin-antitoxin system death-on-curing family toxin [Candidatus Magasanikbacteria bacterium]|nr:type II toxin-antitoxin system death-on-curing family toxin [Candidatus Magasanikbacteria bacterium]